ncbi:hypothetical protein [Sphingomonas sp.]|uniref:hypothetical protein n=1 Tax=Sphingomonas sp. TaxID=28214 RepID=UPI0035C7DF09
MIRLLVALIEFLPLVLALLWRLRWVAQRVAAAMARGLVLLVRLALAALTATGCGVATYSVLTTDEHTALPLAAGFAVALAAGAATLWCTRSWGVEVDALEMFGRPPVPQSRPRPVIAPAAPPPQCADPASPDGEETGEARSTAASPALLTPVLRDRLTTTEAALAHAARDAIGVPAADWLTFWRRRVPDLIASAQDVWDDADAAERPAVAADLTASLEAIIAEADVRLAAIRKVRRDLFTTRTNHARARVREG